MIDKVWTYRKSNGKERGNQAAVKTREHYAAHTRPYHLSTCQSPEKKLLKVLYLGSVKRATSHWKEVSPVFRWVYNTMRAPLFF